MAEPITAASAPFAPPGPDPRTDTDLELAGQLSTELIRFVRLINHVRTHVSLRRGLEQSAYPLLGIVVTHGPRRMTALAEAVHTDPSTVSRQVSVLISSGLLERRADPDDGRACLLAATAKGHELYAELHRKRTEFLAGLLADWSLADRGTLVDLVDRLNSEIENFQPPRTGGDTETGRAAPDAADEGEER